MAHRTLDFQTIRSEGGLLPPDLLRRVLDPKEKLDGTRPEDYGLPNGERPSEVVTQSWNRLRKHWLEFRAAATRLPVGEPGIGLTNDKWSLPLLRELGFGLLPTTAGPELGGRTYAISRFFGPVPVHLVGCGMSLDRRAAGVRGAAAANPHGLVQEFLNRSTGHVWAIVSNGLRLRILRDNQALSRQSFVEFDLEAMFAGEVYSDFVVLWLVAHATRFMARDADRAETCWLEQWTKVAAEQGTRALGELRGGVERALVILGEGFTSHPKNVTLRESLRSGQASLADFHGQLLRVVYRLIFLFVAEDRTIDGESLLHPRDESETARVARERYAAHYSAARLRDLASVIKGSRHGDLWRQFQLLVGALSGQSTGGATREHLALPALGGFLWDPASTAKLNGAELTNHDFLEALRDLAFTRRGKMLRPVDYKNLGAEELGGVYESLLALTPQISADGARFNFTEFAGNDRKTSGSYYTPDSLVQCLLDSALDPVVAEALSGKSGAEAENAILALKVCDPAVGSGHFLVGAAHRLARHLARVRATAQGESEPSPLLYQHALRDVIGRCLYGVDINPMAAELCRVSLWLEALEPGKPLSFLDHHIRVGNSLLGGTPALIAAGVPDEAFTAIEGDDRKACAVLKKRNKAERDGALDMLHLMESASTSERVAIETRVRGIEAALDSTIDEVNRKAEQYRTLVMSSEYRHAQQVADAWCAAFVWVKKMGTSVDAITTDTIRRLTADSGALASEQAGAVERLADHYQFFHWHLAFPEVSSGGGFDCVLGNPPWEKLQVEEQGFFASRDHAIAPVSSKTRKPMIQDLRFSDEELYADWIARRREVRAVDVLLKSSGRFPLTGAGKLNSYSLFAELAHTICAPFGRVGTVLPVGLVTDEGNSSFFGHLVSNRRLAAVFGFENESLIFPTVHHSFKFCLLVFTGCDLAATTADLVFFCRSAEDVRDPERRYLLDTEDVRRLNPNTLTCPIFRNGREAEIVRHIYRHMPVIWSEREDPAWKVKIQRILNATDDVGLFDVVEPDSNRQHFIAKVDGTTWEPVIEAKMFHQFDHRFGSYVGQTVAQANQGKLPEFTSEDHGDPHRFAQPRWWVETRIGDHRSRALFPRRWTVALRDVTSPVVLRTAIAAVIPHFCTTHTSWCVFFEGEAVCAQACAFVGAFNTFVFDFVCRTKFSGNHLSVFVVKQLPMDSARALDEALSRLGVSDDWIPPRVLELSYTSWDVEPFAKDCGWSCPPFRWDEDRRFLLRCELDAAFFHVYLAATDDGQWKPARITDGGVRDETTEELAELKRHFPSPREALVYIMDTFPIVRRRDEEKFDGDYRTKRVILDIYDSMQEAIRTGHPYQTCLDPPPADPRCCHPPREGTS